MTNKNIPSYALEENDKGDIITSADVSYDFQVGMKIRECSMNQSTGLPSAFYRSVESLQSLLNPYLDETYKSAIKEVAKKCSGEARRFHSLDRSKLIVSVRASFTRKKFELLLELADRKNFLAKKGVRQ